MAQVLFVNFVKFIRKPFLIKHLCWLPLNIFTFSDSADKTEEKNEDDSPSEELVNLQETTESLHEK